MKSKIRVLLKLIIFVIIIAIIIFINKLTQSHTEKDVAEIIKRLGVSNLVSGNGNLYVDGTNLKNMYHENFQLKGISSHGIQWYYDLLTKDNLTYLRDVWGINVFRIAMYTNENGYISNPTEIKQKAYNLIDMCIDLDLYVIIDWHTLSDNDPNMYIEEAKAFFEETSLKYQNVPNLIYEICNEPNQGSVTWSNQIKPYAEEIIPIIRNNSKDSVILVGTPTWCVNLNDPTNEPLDFNNIMYTFHFYAGTHKSESRNTITKALENGLPVFISEWGTTDISGNSGFDAESTMDWIHFMDENNLSWINWSFSNKDEDSAILTSEYSNETLQEGLTIDNYISESGNLVRQFINTKKYNPLYEY